MHYVSVIKTAAQSFKRDLDTFRRHDGGLRMSQALHLGITRKKLYAMRDAGAIQLLSRGFYRRRKNPGRSTGAVAPCASPPNSWSRGPAASAGHSATKRS